MKNACLSFFCFTLCFLLFSTCDKLPRNGRLDGQWQLLRVDGVDVRDRAVYWCVQLDLLQLRSTVISEQTPVEHSGGVIFRFRHRSDSLFLPEGFLMDRTHGHDIPILPNTPVDLTGFGIDAVPTRYRVVRLTWHEMVLRNDRRRLEFRKF